MPEEKLTTAIGRIDAYLVEARSIGGLSGSPVFVNLGIMRDREGVLESQKMAGQTKRASGGVIYLLGLMHGHFDQQSVNTGIGIVVPASKIPEVINQESIMKMEKEARETILANKMSVMDSLDPEASDEVFTRENFEAALRKVSRKIEPGKNK